jgi:hypothetical protein
MVILALGFSSWRSIMSDQPELPRTLLDKLWQRHQISEVQGECLLYTDYLLLYEGAEFCPSACMPP